MPIDITVMPDYDDDRAPYDVDVIDCGTFHCLRLHDPGSAVYVSIHLHSAHQCDALIAELLACKVGIDADRAIARLIDSGK